MARLLSFCSAFIGVLVVGCLAITAVSGAVVLVERRDQWIGAAPTVEPTASPVPTATPSPTPTRSPHDFGPQPSLNLDALLSLAGSPLPPNLDPTQLRVLVVTGDVIPARFTNYKLTVRNDFVHPFRATQSLLADGDLRFINLEAPLIRNCPIAVSGYTFCGDVRFIDGLTFAKIDVANVANNHAGNYGVAGIDETIARLNAVGISVTGASNIVTKTVRGLTFAFLGFNGVGQPVDREKLRALTAEARTRADVVVVQFHWGREEVLFPQGFGDIAPDDPREIGRLAIDAGADLVIGNHPHWVQGVELYRDKLITYAHGNFIFDQNFSFETREGVIGRYVFYGNRLVAARFFPVRIDDYTQPRPLSGPEADAVLGRMRDSTKQMLARPFAPPAASATPTITPKPSPTATAAPR